MDRLFLFSALLVALVTAVEPDPSFDFQTETYYSQFKPVPLSSRKLNITTYFSPDNSILEETRFLQGAKYSIDVATPGFESWSQCTEWWNPPIGCTTKFLRQQEAFPIFHVLLNAIHRGIKVRILTNSDHLIMLTKPGTVTPLEFLLLAGAEIRYYQQTTFMHSKYLAVDGKAISVSSINWDFTSFMLNREAGVFIEGEDAQEVVDFTTKVFDSDFSQAIPWRSYPVSEEAMSWINDSSMDPIVIPAPENFPGAFVTSVGRYTGAMGLSIFTSPDYAHQTAVPPLNNLKGVNIYQITSEPFCDAAAQLDSILVSEKIVSNDDWKAAQACYDKLEAGGTKVYYANSGYHYDHAKYWLVGDDEVWLSTGNWGSTDFPNADTFPPYGKDGAGWMNVNRDFTVRIKNKGIYQQYAHILLEDTKAGTQRSSS